MKNILICVSGLTPQIITEALFCLSVQKKIIIDELYVVTTLRGRDVLLGNDSKVKYPALKSEMEKMCKRFKVKLPKFELNDNHIIVARDQSIELHDIRNDKQNKLFPNKLCEFINEKTRDKENKLYCSISGGRKSMSVDMAFALSLFGRENDKLIHVLTHEKFEFKGFYPTNKKEEKELEIAELPYVRLRSIISKKTKNKNFFSMKYTDIVSFTQAELKTAFNKLELDEKFSSFTFGEFGPVRLERAELILYKFLLTKKLNGEESCSTQIILKECPHLFNSKTLLQKISKINKKIRESIDDIEIESRLVIQGPTLFGPTNYGVMIDSSNIKLS